MLIKFLLNGKEINLTSDNATIKSNNFNVDENGNMTCSNATVNGGKIDLYANRGETRLKVYNNDIYTGVYPGGISVHDGISEAEYLVDIGFAQSDENFGMIHLVNDSVTNETKIYSGAANFWRGDSNTYIGGEGITTPSVTQTSREEQKKNFEKLENGLDIIKNTEIYKYNLKSQADGDKKHIGFIIGKNYRYSNEITALDKEGREVGVDTYSMISVAYKAIQEQQELIKQLQEKVKELEEK